MNKYFNNSGHINEEFIAVCADKLQTETLNELPLEIQDHLEDCLECKQNVELAIEVQQTDIDSSRIKPKQMIPKTRRLWPLLQIAAILAIIAIGISTIYYIKTNKINNQNNNLTVVKPDTNGTKKNIKLSTVDSVKKVQVADKKAYKELAYMEDMISMVDRSENFILLLPKPNQRFDVNQYILFKWRFETPNPLKIIIINNAGVTILVKDINTSQFQYNQTLKRGLYYYKLVCDDDLVAAGKFTVK